MAKDWTPVQHYEKAQAILDSISRTDSHSIQELKLREAQVHATLACLPHSTIEIDGTVYTEGVK